MSDAVVMAAVSIKQAIGVVTALLAAADRLQLAFGDPATGVVMIE